MSEPRFKIVFDGALLPGVEKNSAQQKLAELFKSDIAAIEPLFGGQPVVLKRELSQADADRYLEALHNTGIAARIEAEQALDLNLAHVEHTPPVAAPIASSNPESPYAPPRATVGEVLPEFSELKVFSIQGRIGRLRYLAWTLVLTVAMMVVVGIGALIGFASLMSAESSGLAMGFGALVAIVLFVAFVVVSIQISVQRLHDLGWSGWLWLINFVPIVGSFFPLVLVVSPGSNIANRYGPPPPPNTTAVKALAWMWVALIALIIVAGVAGGLSSLSEYSESSSSYSESQNATGDEDAAEAASPAVDYEEE